MKKISLILAIFCTTILAQDVKWLEEANKRMKWKDAMQYCKNQKAKLPTRKDFQKIWFENNKASDIKGFELSVSYWTRDEVKDNKYAAYPFYFVDGRETWYYKADRYGVRCVK